MRRSTTQPPQDRTRTTQQGARRIVATVLTSALFITAPLAVPALADPDDASSVAEDATTLAELDAAIAQLEAEQDAAYQQLLTAGEEYVTAVDAYKQATEYADQAAEKAADAGERAKESRRFVARIARESSRGSNALDALGAFFISDGLEELVAETEALGKVDEKTDEKLQQYQADKLVADILQRKALEATADARAKRDESTAALKVAEQLEAQAEQNTKNAEAKRTKLIAEAAAARQASIEEEEARQNELAAQRAEADRQATLDRIARQEEQAKNDNVEVDEVSRPTPTPTATAEPTQEPEETKDPEPSPSKTTATPTPTPTKTKDPEPSPSKTTATPTPTPTPTKTKDPEPTPSKTTATPTPTPTPTPTKTKGPEPEPTTQPSSDPYGLGKGTSVGSASKGKTAIAEAKKHIGKPYQLGAAGPDTFDCSGLTSVAWSAAGVSITRTSRSQYKHVLKISLSNIRPGDLLFWGTGAGSNNADSIYHVAMYIGNGQMIEAVRPGKPLAISSVRYNSQLMPFAGRP